MSAEVTPSTHRPIVTYPNIPRLFPKAPAEFSPRPMLSVEWMTLGVHILPLGGDEYAKHETQPGPGDVGRHSVVIRLCPATRLALYPK